MGRRYYLCGGWRQIGGWKRGRSGSRRRFSGGRILLFSVAVLVALLCIFNFQLYPGIAALASAAARNRVQLQMAEAFSEKMAAGSGAYDELVTVQYRQDGVVSSLKCDMPGLNAARNELFLCILRGLASQDALTVSLPLGNLLGGELFSGRGPALEVRVLLAQGAHAYMASEFRTVGINQTLHRVLFTVTVSLTVMTPSHPIEMEVTQSYCVAETVIVGEVPDAYTEIHRMTDDITEQEIDDIYDFGAEAP